MNAVDLGVIGVIGLSALLALMRGLVSEVLSVGGWVGAALVTLYAFPRLQPYMRAHVEPTMLADGMATAGVFVLTLIVFSVLAHSIAKAVRNSALGPIDRSLGLLFGVARGALLVCLAWMVVVWLMPDKDKDQPTWLREAKVRPLAETGAAWLQSMVPAEMRENAAAHADTLRARATQTMQDEALRRIPTGRTDTPAPGAVPAEGGGYNRQDREGLNRLTGNAN